MEPGSLPVVPELVQSALELPKIPVAKRHPQLSLIHAEKNSEGCSGISVIEGISALEIDKHDCKQIRDHATFDDEDFVQVCECKSDREQDSEEEWNLVF